MDAKTMSDNSRRTVCRMAFILLCALPLSLIVYRIFHPISATQWQQAIKANLGLTAQIGSVETPLPFVTLFHDVKLLDPERHELIVHLDELKVVMGATNEIIVENKIQIDSSALAMISQQLRQNLMRTHAATDSWKLTLNEAVLMRPNSEIADKLTFAPIQVSVHPYPEYTTAKVEFFSGGFEEPIEVSMRRYRNEATPRESFSIHSGKTYLPCWILNDFWPDSKSFGKISQFAGYAKFERNGESWNGSIVPGSCFLNMSLSSLSQQFGDAEGLCFVRVANCQLKANKIVSLDLQCSSQSGNIDTATINFAKTHLAATWMGEPRKTVYKNLDLKLQFTEGRLLVTTSQPNGVAAWSGDQPLLRLPQQTQPVAIHFVAPFLGGNVPDVSSSILNRFHMPDERIANDTGQSDTSFH